MEAPDNHALSAAMRTFFEASDDEQDRLMRPVLEAFVSSTLIALEEDSEEDSNRALLLLFTDLVELYMFKADAPWTTVPAEEAIRMVAEGEFEGLVLNPGAREIELSRDDVVDFFEIDAPADVD